MSERKLRAGSVRAVLAAFLLMVVGIGGNVIAIKYILLSTNKYSAKTPTDPNNTTQ